LSLKSSELDYISSLLKKHVKKEQENKTNSKINTDNIEENNNEVKIQEQTNNLNKSQSISNKNESEKIARLLVHVRIDEPIVKWIEEESKKLNIGFSKTTNLILKFAYQNYLKNNN